MKGKDDMKTAGWTTVALCFLAAVLGAAHAADTADTAGRATLSQDGFGPVHWGMTVAEAGKALGTALAVDGAPGDCHWESAKSLPGLDFMVENGRITRADLSDPRWATDRGLHLGDPEKKARQLYGRDLESWGEKDPEVHRFIVQSKARQRALFLESDGKTITTLRAGRQPSVEYYEGCE